MTACSISGCSRPYYARGWCKSHYSRWERKGDPEWKRFTRLEYLKKSVQECDNETECLVWPFAKTMSGYGTVTVNNRTRLASRVVSEMAHGKPPTVNHHAAHSCGKGHMGCFNPHHLRWATATENQMDRLKHGTFCNKGNVKLTPEDVALIRGSSLSNARLAAQYKVGKEHIRRVRAGLRWSRVA